MITWSRWQEARLQVTDAQGRRVVLLDTPSFTIGRRSASNLQVVSTDVSREHARSRALVNSSWCTTADPGTARTSTTSR